MNSSLTSCFLHTKVKTQPALNHTQLSSHTNSQRNHKRQFFFVSQSSNRSEQTLMLAVSDSASTDYWLRVNKLCWEMKRNERLVLPCKMQVSPVGLVKREGSRQVFDSLTRPIVNTCCSSEQRLKDSLNLVAQLGLGYWLTGRKVKLWR